MEFFGYFISADTIEIFKHLLVAAGLGMLLGLERVVAHKMAGMRTYGLVSLGSALFIVISGVETATYAGITPFDPLRIAASVVTGIGFISAGIIIFRNSHVEGLTTAAGLWVAAGIGMAAGFGLYAIATFTTLVTLFIFTAVWFFENKIKNATSKWNDKDS
ncbi:MAG: MgtC/SapB family protein [bacterium]|nr:MgtC/SapB family protein [bacterium]